MINTGLDRLGIHANLRLQIITLLEPLAIVVNGAQAAAGEDEGRLLIAQRLRVGVNLRLEHFEPLINAQLVEGERVVD